MFMRIQIYIYIYNMFICKSSITHSKLPEFPIRLRKKLWRFMDSADSKNAQHSGKRLIALRYFEKRNLVQIKWLFCLS